MNICDICGKDFKYPSKLLRHLNNKKSCSPKEKMEKTKEIQETVNENQDNVTNSKSKFQCEKCEKTFTSKQSLNYHSNICKGVNSLQCPTCFKTFTNRVSKCRHLKKCSQPKEKSIRDLQEENEIHKCSLPKEKVKPNKNSVYLLIEREFLITDQDIFKIGRSVNVSNRARQYPKGSQLLVVLPCIDSVVTEGRLKRVFSEKFKVRSDIGSEYYEGPPNSVIEEFVRNVPLHF